MLRLLIASPYWGPREGSVPFSHWGGRWRGLSTQRDLSPPHGPHTRARTEGDLGGCPAACHPTPVGGGAVAGGVTPQDNLLPGPPLRTVLRAGDMPRVPRSRWRWEPNRRIAARFCCEPARGDRRGGSGLCVTPCLASEQRPEAGFEVQLECQSDSGG